MHAMRGIADQSQPWRNETFRQSQIKRVAVALAGRADFA